jgi:hypothetical protein
MDIFPERDHGLVVYSYILLQCFFFHDSEKTGLRYMIYYLGSQISVSDIYILLRSLGILYIEIHDDSLGRQYIYGLCIWPPQRLSRISRYITRRL